MLTKKNSFPSPTERLDSEHASVLKLSTTKRTSSLNREQSSVTLSCDFFTHGVSTTVRQTIDTLAPSVEYRKRAVAMTAAQATSLTPA